MFSAQIQKHSPSILTPIIDLCTYSQNAEYTTILEKNIKLPKSLTEILNNHPYSIANIIQFITTSNLHTKI